MSELKLSVHKQTRPVHYDNLEYRVSSAYSEFMLTKEYQDIEKMEIKLGMDMSGLMMVTFENWVKNKEAEKEK